MTVMRLAVPQLRSLNATVPCIQFSDYSYT